MWLRIKEQISTTNYKVLTEFNLALYAHTFKVKSAITKTPLLVLPCWPPSEQWPMTIAVLEHWMEMAPYPFFLSQN